MNNLAQHAECLFVFFKNHSTLVIGSNRWTLKQTLLTPTPNKYRAGQNATIFYGHTIVDWHSNRIQKYFFPFILSAAQMGSNHEKNSGQNSRDTRPFNAVLKLRFDSEERTFLVHTE